MNTQSGVMISHEDRGWALASTGVALVILVMVVIWGAGRWNEYWDKRDWQVSAVQVSRYAQALRAYTAQNYDTLLAAATTTTPVSITTAMLKNTGFLEAGFSDNLSAGQQLHAVLIRNATNTGVLQGLIVSQGGTPLPFMALRDISVAVTTGLGGYLWNSTTTVTGANNSWSVPLSGFGLSSSGGHIAALLTADELTAARQDTDRLYRFAVTGNPDLNRMHTSIDMGANNLNNTGSVNAISGNFSGAVAAGSNVTAGGNVTANGGMTAAGDIRSTAGWLISRGSKGWLNETWQGGFYMSDSDWVRAVNNTGIYTGGQMRGGSVRADGRLSTGDVLQLDEVNTAGAGCSLNGLVSRDSVGAILSCQNGKWVSSGGSGFKAPPPQTISCGTSYNTYVDMTVYARVDNTGQVYTRMDTDSDISTDWIKGSTAGVADITIGGLTGHGSYTTCASGNACTSHDTVCFAGWNWG
ncbi:MAG TPA: shufflon system plasmid conjugative transfer pilus tip adhesin PilV [Scandinavium sp.]|jgi:hypothetical protein